MQPGYQQQQFRPPIQAPTNPNFHPAACNICGQLGHQAVNCSIGTIRWKDIYGEDAFIIRPPLYWSEIQEKRKRKIIDLVKLENDAKEFAKQTSATLGLDYNKMMQEAIKSAEAKEALEELRREREAMGIIEEQYEEDESEKQQQQVEEAQRQLAQMNPPGQQQILQQQFQQQQQPQQQFVGVAQQNFGQVPSEQVQFQYVQQQPGQQPAQVQQPPQVQQQPPTDALPKAWAQAKDPQGRVYYWHRKTHKTQWEKPTEDTPTE